jgi:acetyl-CoA carboxylase carboxyl transferase subunit alpha
MELAGRFKRPILCFIDTTGAYPGVDAEERGQAEAIAKNLEVMSALPVPIVAAVIGEGGSGGALALGVADRILMLEYAVYSVISPEGCASILWRDDDKKGEAAAAMKMTASDLHRLGVVDEVVPEAPGGAHRDFDATARNLGSALRRHLAELWALPPDRLRELRYQKYRAMGAFVEA